MLKKKSLTIFTALVTALALAPAITGTVQADAEQGNSNTVTVKNAQEFLDAFNDSGSKTIKLDKTIGKLDLGGKSDGRDYHKIHENADVTVDLNGNSVVMTGHYLCTNNDSTLTVKNGTIVSDSDVVTVFEVKGDNSNLDLENVKASTTHRVIDADQSGNITIANSDFESTSGENVYNADRGGAIYAPHKNITIENTAIKNYKSSDCGGAIYANNTNITIGKDANDKSEFSGNVAKSYGGVIASHGSNYTITVNGGTFENNTAHSLNGQDKRDNYFGGGAIRLCGGNGTNGKAEFVMHGGMFSNNRSDLSGGGAIKAGHYQNDENIIVRIYNGSFVNNSSYCEGGALSVGNLAHASIGPRDDHPDDHVEFSGNHVDDDTVDWGGGAIFIANGGDLKLNKAVIHDNTANGFGGGLAGCSTGRIIYNNQGGAETGVAIYNNHAKGTHLSGGESEKHEDHTYTEGNDAFHKDNQFQDYFCALDSEISNVMLGGGNENWHGTHDNVEVTDADRDINKTITGSFLTGLSADPSEPNITAAEKLANVVIQNNHSGTHGGGILINGIVVMGDVPELSKLDDRMAITASKAVQKNDGSAMDYAGDCSFKLFQIDNGQIVDDTAITKTAPVYTVKKVKKGEITNTIPFDIHDGEDGEITRTWYLQEVPGKDKTVHYDDTVYKMDVTGKYNHDSVSIGADRINMPRLVLQITGVAVTKGTINGNQFVADKDPAIPYVYNIGTGDNHAKLLVIGTNAQDGSHASGNHYSVNNVTTDAFINKKVTYIDVQKKWNDSNNKNKVRPASVTVRLYADGKEVASSEKTLDQNNNWSEEWADLNTVNNDGSEIKYTVKEDNVDGYESSVSSLKNHTYTITNTALQTFSVRKVWDDNNNADAFRTEFVTVQLKSNGNNYGDPVRLDDSNNWSYQWKNLPNKIDGKNAVYTIEEENIPQGYKATYKDGVLTNTHVTDTTSYTVTKQWNDDNNHDGLRPSSVQVQLYAGDQAVGDPVTVTEKDGWKYTWNDLAKNSYGMPIKYHAKEVGNVAGYTASEDIDGVITNTHETEKTSVTTTKTWDDHDNANGVRPSEVKVQLLKDNEKYGDPVTLSSDTDWTYTWNDLDKLENVNGKSQEVQYTVSEEPVIGYTASYDGTNITNTYTPGTTSYKAVKHWDDGDNTDGTRPESVQFQLYANGTVYGDPVTVTSEDDWAHEWTELPDTFNGEPVTYTVDEVNVPDGYEKAVDGNVITNSHTPNPQPSTDPTHDDKGDDTTIPSATPATPTATPEVPKTGTKTTPTPHSPNKHGKAGTSITPSSKPQRNVTQRTSSPDTSDRSNVVLYTVIFSLAVAAALAMIRTRKKYN